MVGKHTLFKVRDAAFISTIHFLKYTCMLQRDAFEYTDFIENCPYLLFWSKYIYFFLPECCLIITVVSWLIDQLAEDVCLYKLPPPT